MVKNHVDTYLNSSCYCCEYIIKVSTHNDEKFTHELYLHLVDVSSQIDVNNAVKAFAEQNGHVIHYLVNGGKQCYSITYEYLNLMNTYFIQPPVSSPKA
jgi:hypothetical protein